MAYPVVCEKETTFPVLNVLVIGPAVGFIFAVIFGAGFEVGLEDFFDEIVETTLVVDFNTSWLALLISLLKEGRADVYCIKLEPIKIKIVNATMER